MGKGTCKGSCKCYLSRGRSWLAAWEARRQEGFTVKKLLKIFEGHPQGLPWLFATEAWERFCYYGMRAILMLYMTKFLFVDMGEKHIVTEHAGSIYGWFTGLVYLAPVLGGFVADRYIGKRKSVIIGAILMGLGYLTMAIPQISFFYVALGLVIFGNGFFKPNITPMVSELYDEKDKVGRLNGMTIFYMGINLGAIFSPLVCGTLGENYGWHWGFIAAGVGMVFALVIFIAAQKRLGEVGLKKSTSIKKKEDHKPLTTTEKHQVAVIFIMAFFVIFFWVTFEQAGSSLTLFADRSTDRMVFGWNVPASWFQSVNPIFIVLLAIPMTRLWKWLSERGKNPSTPAKMAIGLFLASLGFLILIPASMLASDDSKVTMLWLIGVYFTHTVGELCLSPVGLDMVTKLSPKKFVSMLIGVWFVANFAANKLAGQFAALYDSMEMTDFFWVPVITSGIAGLLLLVVLKPIKKLMHGVE